MRCSEIAEKSIFDRNGKIQTAMILDKDPF
jgi:hypothetical protein